MLALTAAFDVWVSEIFTCAGSSVFMFTELTAKQVHAQNTTRGRTKTKHNSPHQNHDICTVRHQQVPNKNERREEGTTAGLGVGRKVTPRDYIRGWRTS